MTLSVATVGPRSSWSECPMWGCGFQAVKLCKETEAKEAEADRVAKCGEHECINIRFKFKHWTFECFRGRMSQVGRDRMRGCESLKRFKVFVSDDCRRVFAALMQIYMCILVYSNVAVNKDRSYPPAFLAGCSEGRSGWERAGRTNP